MKYTNELKIGGTVIFAILIGVIGFRVLKDVPIFENGRVITSTYPKVDGLSSGNKIFFNGVDIGTIKEIILLQNDSVEVVMSVDKPFDIPVDSRASIVATNFLGSKAILIEKGKSSEIIEYPGRLIGEYDEGALSELQEKGLSLGDQVVEIGDNLNKTLTKVNETIDEEFQKDLKKTIDNVSNTTKEAQKILQNNQSKIDNSLASLSSALASIDTLTTENRDEIKGTITELRTQLEELGALNKSLQNTSNQLTELLSKLNSGEGTIGKMVTDPSLYNQLDSLTLNLQRLVRNIDRNPKKYLKHIDIKLF